MPAIAARDLQGKCEPGLLNAVLTVLALAKGDLKLDTVLMHMDSSEVNDWLEERLGWSGVYRQA